jgi:hypothetical protein
MYVITAARNDYFTCTDELTSIADAIRTKGGTSASLTYPSGFVTAINNLPTKVLGAGTIGGYDSPFDIQVTADDYSAGEWDGFSSVSINISTPFYDGSCDIINPLITFTIGNATYQAEEGMTWGEWVNTEYNTAGYFINVYDHVTLPPTGIGYIETVIGDAVHGNDIMTSNTYLWNSTAGGGGDN